MRGYFDDSSVPAGWFDETSQAASWIDADRIDVAPEEPPPNPPPEIGDGACAPCCYLSPGALLQAIASGAPPR